jgi:hypothetical protein
MSGPVAVFSNRSEINLLRNEEQGFENQIMGIS